MENIGANCTDVDIFRSLSSPAARDFLQLKYPYINIKYCASSVGLIITKRPTENPSQSTEKLQQMVSYVTSNSHDTLPYSTTKPVESSTPNPTPSSSVLTTKLVKLSSYQTTKSPDTSFTTSTLPSSTTTPITTSESATTTPQSAMSATSTTDYKTLASALMRFIQLNFNRSTLPAESSQTNFPRETTQSVTSISRFSPVTTRKVGLGVYTIN